MIYVSLGIPSSASTWVFNILKAILQKRDTALDAYQCETLGDLERRIGATGRAHVWKAHNLQHPLLRMIELTETPIVISIRDPRDAVASLVGRFNANPVDSAQQVMRSIASVFSATAAARRSMVCVYETSFPERVETVQAIADLMRVSLAPAEIIAIQGEFSLAQVKKFTAGLDALPQDRLVRNGDDVMDAETQFHRVHVSDAAIGKWRGVLAPDLHDDIDELFDPVAGMAFYDPGMQLVFGDRLFRGAAKSESPPGSEYRRPGFCLLEHVYLGRGMWQVELDVHGAEGLQQARRLLVIQLGQVLGEVKLEGGRAAARLAFEFQNIRHDTHLEVFLDQPPELRFTGETRPRATLRATYLRGV
jgi:hypothetical protein